MSVLEKINSPSDLHIIKKDLLPELAADIRSEIIQTVSRNGGHIAPSLGTVELTIALHYVYDMPADKIVWDVGHQAYAHKILTGRRDSFSTLRTHGGISGFPRMAESPYDSFGVGHSSTAISAALGLAVARDLNNQSHKVVAVIGDGSMTGGLSFEGLQNAGHLGNDLLVILNDNQMFISHRVGALAGYLAKIMTAGTLKKFEKKAEQFFKRIHVWGSSALRVAKRFKVLLFPGMLFEEMGFAYIGPVQGHDTNQLIEILAKVREMKGPVLLHVVTKKGKGYLPAEEHPSRFHGIGRFNLITGEPETSTGPASFTKVFSQTLVRLAREDSRVVAVTAAMPEGTGVEEFAAAYPHRFFDVGIAEGHAVTFAGGLAAAGLRPVVAIYSTFLQRGFDQIIHDIALQNLPVIFAIDRAGLVGEDGATHHGSFDISFLRLIPNLTVMAPADENELQHMLKTALTISGPVAIRYPRGAGFGVTMDRELKILPVGTAQVLREGDDVCLLAIGTTVQAALQAADILAGKNIRAGVVNMRCAKPLDEALIKSAAARTKKLVTIEENSRVGGLYSAVCEIVAGTGCAVLPIALPDAFVEHGSQQVLRTKYGLSAETMASAIAAWR